MTIGISFMTNPRGYSRKRLKRLRELIERWQQVERVMMKMTRHQRRKHFDMRTFGERTDCGTIACAAGFCGLDRWFQRQGVVLKFTRSDDGDLVGEMSKNTPGFFGFGYHKIFADPEERSHAKVLQEIREHIAGLRYELQEWVDAEKSKRADLALTRSLNEL